MSELLRRDFLKAGAAGLVAATAPAQLAGLRSATRADLQGLVGDGRRRRILLRGGAVLSLDARGGDFEKADVLIDGTKIAAVGPNVSANLGSNAEVIDCAGTIVMPGFITTHHHQYETLQRSLIPDGLLAGSWPQESYGSVVQNIWTAGRIADPANPANVIWDLGRVPYDPEDLYICELVACLSEITEGVTMGTDTSQASHSPDHTDAMIQGLVDSGRRMVYDYSPGIDRRADGIPYEFPGAMGDTTKGIGRIAKKYFSSRDQLVTLGYGAGPTEAFPAPATPDGSSDARSAPSSTITTSVARTLSSMLPPTRGISPIGPTSRSFIAPGGRTNPALRSVTTERGTRTAASRRPGRFGETEGLMSRLPCSSRCKCGTGCLLFKMRSITASCRV